MAAVTQIPEANPVGTADRLSFSLFLATALHAALILGVTFTYVTSEPAAHTMEVTLAQQRSKNAPDKADYLAQFNQAGSGTLDQKALLTSPTEAQYKDTEIRETAEVTPQNMMQKSVEEEQRLVTTIADMEAESLTESNETSTTSQQTEFDSEQTLRIRTFDIASLEARLDQQQQMYAKRPRIKRLTSLATAASADAYYLNSWRRKVESIGNLNYPEEARRRKLYGSLRLMVSIMPDGNLKDVQLLESSGHKVLDDAALRIVRLASPFAPFPDELRETTDVLEIIRTWKFQKNSSIRAY